MVINRRLTIIGTEHVISLLLSLTEITEKLREGQLVKVRSGSFAGVEGKIVRIRKSRRLLVELPGMLAIASTYVRPEDIESLN